ncbi:cerebellin 20 [Genypterus blacodes]|uniref:cerebellin 20 n=1 Tax=Genypterus blacodes TaxID=154954 RepID=UPI003F768544
MRVCLADQASCGCCLMQKQMNRMEMYFNLTLNALEVDLQNTKAVINNLRASRSAVSASLNNERTLVYIGPFREETVIHYRHVFINIGNHYNPDSGVYTVPRSGVYNIALTVYADAGARGNTLAACASLRVNGAVLFGPSERYANDQEDSSTIVQAVQLQAGNRVDVILPIGCFLSDDHSHYNTFTIFLLYATD